MMKSDDSRKRSFMIVAAIIFIGASLGYMYSYSKSNHMLIVKYDAIKLNYLTCSKDLQKCSADMDECMSASEKWKHLKIEGEMALEAENAKVLELRSEYEEAETKLDALKKSFSDIGLLVGLFDDAAIEQNMTKEKIDLIIEKIEKLKKNKMEFDELTTKYNSLLDEIKKINEEKETFKLKVQEEQNAKSLVQAELYNLKADAVKMENAKSDPTTKVDEPKESDDVNVAPLPVTSNSAPGPDASAGDADTATSLNNAPSSDQSNQDGNTETDVPDEKNDQIETPMETLEVEAETTLQ